MPWHRVRKIADYMPEHYRQILHFTPAQKCYKISIKAYLESIHGATTSTRR
jgi:hypothetical protein